MMKTEKVVTVTCDWCEREVGEAGLHAGKLSIPAREGAALEIRLVVPSETAKGRAVTLSDMDICEECWRSVVEGGEVRERE